MAGANSGSSGIPWYSWVALVIMLAWCGMAFYAGRSPIVPAGLRWGVTGLWVVVTLILGLLDFVFARGDDSGRDATPVDRWTISHSGAGVVFGIWYIPLLYLLILTIVWELFEFSVRGFGDKEVFLNRVVDVSVAVIGWLAVVVVVALVAHAPFPLITPFRP